MQPTKTVPPPAADDVMTTEELVRDVIPDADVWLDEPNSRLGGRTPRELIGTEGDYFVRRIALAVKYGVFG